MAKKAGVAARSVRIQDQILWGSPTKPVTDTWHHHGTDEQLPARPVTNIHVDQFGCDSFEITLSARYGFDYDEELSGEVDENGFLELDNGEKMAFDTVKRIGYDSFQLTWKNSKEKIIDIVSEELA